MLHIQVVGPGCANCQKLEQICKEVVAEEHLDATVEKISDISKFADLGVLITPGLLVNGKLLSSGKIPTKHTLVHWLQNESA
ncbi:MAG: TM0996/MTH895 family glutaredoxin-like protein [Calditrichaeota bacterium]|nr:TM0996/MTH895 family glutaredoxin-like protein [Calditrichota bacterium]MCB0268277.1 TM0996/MTH895 family glutaredoxin-like protein [Calditrichota bacterium]